ncbi:MAG: hypothetical protein II333_01470, partial [Clostridia bacterium]|nr:hypothetical protein [Clostridia bacterium]
AMEQAIQRKTKKKMPLARRITVCAALFCAALVLMGAGVRIFEYLTFVPGMGIVTADQEEVFTLTKTVSAGGDRIEAASMIPAEDEEHKGMWEVTVLTNRNVPHDFFENPGCMPEMTLYGKENEPYSLTCTGGSVIGARYTGYAVIDPDAENHDYTLEWGGTDCTISMKSMENSVWANYAYPVSDGLTVIAFPLAENSRYLVFDVILDPQSENMEYWATHCESVWYTAGIVSITDAEGNEYHTYGQSGHSVTIPESEREYGVNDLVAYKMEYILTMAEPLAAEIATIDLDEVSVIFNMLEDDARYLVEIPELDEVVPAENLPDGGVFCDRYGIRVAFDEMTTCIDELNDTYDIVFRRDSEVEFDFEENVTFVQVGLGWIEPERAASAERWDYRGGGQSSERGNTSVDIEYSMPFHGAGDLKNKGLALTFGDEVLMRLNSISLTIAGDWHIDFTAEHTD